MSAQDKDTEKPHDPTPRKLENARKKGEIARSPDLTTFASYAGLLLAALAFGAQSLNGLATSLMVLIEQADRIVGENVAGDTQALAGTILWVTGTALFPWVSIPALLALFSILAQRSFVVSVEKISPKLSRISPIKNAANKFGRNGLFEFCKSVVKLLIYSVVLALFMRVKLDDMLQVLNATPMIVVAVLARLCVEFLFLVLLVSMVIGGIDALWQWYEHLRKNRMSRQELVDESKESEGDPQLKQQRRQRGYDIATTRMMQDVPGADVIIVNPTHFAVALKWSRKPGEVPICVAKGVDETAHRIRSLAIEAGVPIRRDPATARAVYATTPIGAEIDPVHYKTVATAIRFAENMRARAKAGSWR